MTRGSSNNVTTYSYDAISRLTSLENDIAGTSMDQTFDFTYTPSGQINTETNSNPAYDGAITDYDQDFAINALNQIMSENGINYTHDSAGNLTQGNGKSYTYDFANRLTSMSGDNYDLGRGFRTLCDGKQG